MFAFLLSLPSSISANRRSISLPASPSFHQSFQHLLHPSPRFAAKIGQPAAQLSLQRPHSFNPAADHLCYLSALLPIPGATENTQQLSALFQGAFKARLKLSQQL